MILKTKEILTAVWSPGRLMLFLFSLSNSKNSKHALFLHISMSVLFALTAIRVPSYDQRINAVLLSELQEAMKIARRWQF